MVNSRGLIRFVEATVAIIIIFGVLLVVYSRTSISQERDLSEDINPILDQIAENRTLREEVLVDEGLAMQRIEKILSDQVTDNGINYTARICDIQETCPIPFANFPNAKDENIYAEERVVSATLDVFSPKKVKIFLWREG